MGRGGRGRTPASQTGMLSPGAAPGQPRDKLKVQPGSSDGPSPHPGDSWFLPALSEFAQRVHVASRS